MRADRAIAAICPEMAGFWRNGTGAGPALVAHLVSGAQAGQHTVEDVEVGKVDDHLAPALGAHLE